MIQKKSSVYITYSVYMAGRNETNMVKCEHWGNLGEVSLKSNTGCHCDIYIPMSSTEHFSLVKFPSSS